MSASPREIIWHHPHAPCETCDAMARKLDAFDALLATAHALDAMRRTCGTPAALSALDARHPDWRTW
jgi:hypothetical protein